MLSSHLFWKYTLSKHLSLEKFCSQVFFKIYRSKGGKSTDHKKESVLQSPDFLEACLEYVIQKPEHSRVLAENYACSHIVYGRLHKKQEELCQKHPSLGASSQGFQAPNYYIRSTKPGRCWKLTAGGVHSWADRKPQKILTRIASLLCNSIRTELSPQHHATHK